MSMPVRPPEPAEPGPASSVNPFIDTAKPRIRWTFTAFAARPFGMVRPGPNTDPAGTWDSGYRYNGARIRCFSHIHAWQLAGVPVMPVTGPVSRRNDFEAHGSRFRHETEQAQPGYYAVHLDDYGIQAEITATERVSVHRYRFPENRPGSLVFNLGAELGPCAMADAEIQLAADGALQGFVENEVTRRRNKRCRIYFVMRLQDRPDGLQLWQPGGELVNAAGARGPGIGAAVRIPAAAAHEVVLKVAVSYVSVEQAARNMDAEMPHWDFDRVRRDSTAIWNQWLSAITVSGGTEDRHTKFYTDLWRSLLGGHLISDVDGSYCDLTGSAPQIRQVLRGPDGKPAHPLINGQDGFWNSQWSLNILYALAYPRVMSHYARYLLQMYRDGSLIPRGPAGYSYSFVMISAPTTPFLVSAWQKGIRTFDVATAYAGMRANAFPGGLMSKAGYEFDTCAGGGIEYYLERDYIPEERSAPGAMHVDGAAQTLEYAYQDWALGQLATVLGKPADARMFFRRARNYRNLFDAHCGFMRPRRMNGGFVEPFDPLALEGFCEANSWQYTWYVPQDVQDLIRLMGGRRAFNEKLDFGFRQAQAMDFYAPKPELRRNAAYVNYGNEPGRYVAHLFNHSGAPWLAQKWARAVRDQTFGSVEPLGFCEDDDQGKAAATSLLLALGLFDVRGGVSTRPVYEITPPVFDRITIYLDPDYYDGGTFTIRTEGTSAADLYIHSARLNGEPLCGPWLYHDQLVRGGELVLELGPEPNRSWGARPGDAPP